MGLEIVFVTVLAERVFPVDASELEVPALSFNVVVNHVDQDGTAEETFFLEHDVDVVELVANSLVLLLGQLGFHGAFAAKTTNDTSLDLEGREDVLEAGEERFLFLLRVVRALLLSATENAAFVTLALEQVAHPDVVNLSVSLVDVGDCLLELGISSGVALEVSPDALTMEGVLARVDEELAIVEHRTKANVAVLGRVDRDVPVLLVAALGTQ